MERVAVGLFIGFMALTVVIAYWAIVRGPALAERADNPRRVEAELRIRRGRILDVNGIVLAETVGPIDDPVRLYPIPTIGPAVGYYSFRHGTAGIEEGYDPVLRGEGGDPWEAIWRRNLHRPQFGRDVRLTLNADWQRNAEAIMGERDGALILLSVPDGAVRAMVSHPGYDPNRLDAQFEELVRDEEAPLLNRATQGQYQPGLVLQPFILSAALDDGVLVLNDSVSDIDQSVDVHEQLKRCRSTPTGEATWMTTLAHACPSPMLDLADAYDPDELTELFDRFGLLAQPDFPMATAPAAAQPVLEVNHALLGQESLTVTPLQIARAWVALGSGGDLPTPYLVHEVQNSAGVWQPASPPESPARAVEASSADALLAALAGDDANVAQHAAVALSGPEAASNAWYLGLAPARTPRVAVVVVIEGAAASSIAEEIGRAVLEMIEASD